MGIGALSITLVGLIVGSGSIGLSIGVIVGVLSAIPSVMSSLTACKALSFLEALLPFLSGESSKASIHSVGVRWAEVGGAVGR